MKPSLLPIWLALAFLLATAYGGYKYYQVQQFQQEKSTAVAERLPPIEEFELATSDGGTFRSKEMLGKVWVTTFFFSTCPGSCTRLNANIKYMNSLENIQDVTWLSISVDPVTDTLPVLAAYAQRLNADPEQWKFARGELDYVKRIGNDFFKLPVVYKDHSDVAAVVDKSGRIAGLYNAVSTSDSKRMEKKLVELLAEPWTPEPEPEKLASKSDDALESDSRETADDAVAEEAAAE